MLVLVVGRSIWGVQELTTENLNVAIEACGFLLFGFTYLYVGIGNLAGYSGSGLEWYCGWAAIAAALLSITNYTRLDDPKVGMLWVLWTVLYPGRVDVAGTVGRTLRSRCGALRFGGDRRLRRALREGAEAD